jgi:hypothetical protein
MDFYLMFKEYECIKSIIKMQILFLIRLTLDIAHLLNQTNRSSSRQRG